MKNNELFDILKTLNTKVYKSSTFNIDYKEDLQIYSTDIIILLNIKLTEKNYKFIYNLLKKLNSINIIFIYNSILNIQRKNKLYNIINYE